MRHMLGYMIQKVLWPRPTFCGAVPRPQAISVLVRGIKSNAQIVVKSNVGILANWVEGGSSANVMTCEFYRGTQR